MTYYFDKIKASKNLYTITCYEEGYEKGRKTYELHPKYGLIN